MRRLRVGDEVVVIRGDAVIQHRNSEHSGNLPQSLSIIRSVTGEAKEERTVVTTVSQVTDLPRLHEAVSPWHSYFLRSYGLPE